MTSAIYPSYINAGSIRTAAILTGSYVVAATWGATGEEQGRNIESSHLVLDITFTKGSLTTGDIKVEYSEDGATWFIATTASTSAGVMTVSEAVWKLGANTTCSLAIALIKHPWVRVSAIGAGTATSSSLALSARFIS